MLIYAIAVCVLSVDIYFYTMVLGIQKIREVALWAIDFRKTSIEMDVYCLDYIYSFIHLSN